MEHSLKMHFIEYPSATLLARSCLAVPHDASSFFSGGCWHRRRTQNRQVPTPAPEGRYINHPWKEAPHTIAGYQSNLYLTPPHPPQKPLHSAFLTHHLAQQDSRRCWRWAQRQASWSNRPRLAKQRPQRLHPCGLGGSSCCLDCKIPRTPEHWLGPKIQGNPGPKGQGRFLLSLSCRGTLTCTPLMGQSPLTSCQLSTKAARSAA